MDISDEEEIGMSEVNISEEKERCCICMSDRNVRNEKGINTGKEANMGFVTRDDSQTATRLFDKNWSPLLVRKYQLFGCPVFVGIICDANLNDLDTLVYKLVDEAEENGFLDGSIQGVRNYCGCLNDGIVKYYDSIKRGCVEGVIVFISQDKCVVVSAMGDFMTHNKCAEEFYMIVNTLPHI